MHPHDESLRSYVRGSFPRVRDVEDIVQESYLRIWKVRLDEPVRSTKAFLFRIARHVAIDLLRRDRSSPWEAVDAAVVADTAEERVSVAEQACTQEELALLAEALLNLPERCRQIVMLQKFEGMRQREIAEQLGLSEDTVQAHVARGMRSCEAFMRKRKALR